MKNKKILILIVAAVQIMSFSMIGCGSSDKNMSSASVKTGTVDSSLSDKEVVQLYLDLYGKGISTDAGKLGLNDDEIQQIVKDVEGKHKRNLKTKLTIRGVSLSDEKFEKIFNSYKNLLDIITIKPSDDNSIELGDGVFNFSADFECINMVEINKAAAKRTTLDLSSNKISEENYYDLIYDNIQKELESYEIDSELSSKEFSLSKINGKISEEDNFTDKIIDNIFVKNN